MRRFAIAASILAVLAVGVPASAGQTGGTVRYPVAAPTVATTAWKAGYRTNGQVGWIERLPLGADGASYTLTTTDGATGAENVDAYFYTDAPDGSGPGMICSVDARENWSSETGTICTGSQQVAWVVVVLVAGYDASFTLHWS